MTKCTRAHQYARMLDIFITFLLGPFFRHLGIGVRSPSNKLIVAPQDDAPSIHFKRWRDTIKIIVSPELTFAECYSEQHIVIENGDVYKFFLYMFNRHISPIRTFIFFRKIAKPFQYFYQGLTPKRSKSNVAAHYDLGNELYELFLDPDKQYSCAYFQDPHQDLATAQQQKKDYIIRKLKPMPGMSALDIGCGWGGLSLDLARAGLSVKGITLSEEQIKTAKNRAAETGLNVDFQLQDYRHEHDKYDRIVSVGMFEHVGKARFQEFFDQIQKNLKDDGIAVIHTIGRPKSPVPVNKFILKYIFPGGHIPSLSEIAPVIEKSGLLVSDIEYLYLHYADTLRHWRMNFMENQDRAAALYDMKFVRIWELYLASSEAAFRAKGMVIFQIQLRKPSSPVDLTRDYMYGPQK